MGRGLSELQKRILALVYEKRQERDFEQEEELHGQLDKDPFHRDLRGGKDLGPYSFRCYPDSDNPKLIAALYDWPVYSRWTPYEEQGRRPSEGARVRGHRHNFRPSQVGVEEYNRRTASYYRAVKRLKERGLLEDHKHGLLITDEGIEAAERLLVSNA